MQFKLATVAVTVRGSFFLVAALLAYDRIAQPVSLAIWVGVVFVSVLVHELGHAVAFLRYGHAPSIELYAMGGVTRGNNELTVSTTEQLVVALAGPGAGFLLAFATWVARGAFVDAGPYAADLLRDLLWVNVGWGIVNLLPVLPLDGGQAMTAVMRKLAPAHASKIALGISALIGAGAAAWSMSVGQWMFAVLSGTLAAGSFRGLKNILARGGNEVLERRLAEGYLALRRDDIHQARQSAQEALATASHPVVVKDAAELLAWAELRDDRPSHAQRAIDDLPHDVQADPRLRGAILLRLEGRENEAVLPLSEAFSERPDPDLGHELLMALVHADELQKAYDVIMGSDGGVLKGATHFEVSSALLFGGRLEDALKVSEIGFARSGDAHLAYNAACALSRLGRLDESVRKLSLAIEAGYDDPDHLEHDEDLADLRGRGDFAAILDQLRLPATG